MGKVSAAGFANEIHQLLVSVSRHLYVTGRGLVKYQEKPMEAVTGNFAGSGKERLVYYVLRDVFSGNESTWGQRLTSKIENCYNFSSKKLNATFTI